MDRIKNTDLKKVDNYSHKKILIVAMLGNTPWTMTYRQQCHEKNKEKCLEKGKWYYEQNKERLQKITHDRYEALYEKDKNK